MTRAGKLLERYYALRENGMADMPKNPDMQTQAEKPEFPRRTHPEQPLQTMKYPMGSGKTMDIPTDTHPEDLKKLDRMTSPPVL